MLHHKARYLTQSVDTAEISSQYTTEIAAVYTYSVGAAGYFRSLLAPLIFAIRGSGLIMDETSGGSTQKPV